MISKKNLNTHMHIHTHIKELLTLNTVLFRYSCIPEHNSLELLQMKKKYSGCMCTFAYQIKTIKLFKYEKNASEYSLFELSTPNNSTYIDAHMGHFMSTPVFVALQHIKN